MEKLQLPILLSHKNKGMESLRPAPLSNENMLSNENTWVLKGSLADTDRKPA